MGPFLAALIFRLDSSIINFYTAEYDNYHIEDVMNELITTILQSPVTAIIGTVVLTCLFWMAGIFGIFNFALVVKEMEDAALTHPRSCAVATIICQLLGSALLISNVGGLAWLGAGALGVFTLLSIPLGHPFWKFAEPRKSHEFQIALEHVTVVGGLVLAAILSVR